MTNLFERMSKFVNEIPHDGRVHERLDRALKSGHPDTKAMLLERVDLLSDEDRVEAAAYMGMGWFVGLEGDHRVAAWMLALELARSHRLHVLESRFKKYEAGQVVFSAMPHLLEESFKNELIEHRPTDTLFEDGVFLREGRHLRLEPLLGPKVALGIMAAFPGVPIYLRIDPDFASAARPKSVLMEATVVPADPAWWKDLGIHHGQRMGSAYTLDGDYDPKTESQAYWDFHVRKVRKLEVHAKRSKPDYLSMMVEELVDMRSTDGYVLGRCIHWDTFAVKGTAPELAPMQHLDLAINVYVAEAADRRMGQQLSSGKVENATFRTHLLRIETLPAQAMLPIATLFFISPTLLLEWFVDQFRMSDGAQ